MASPDSPVLGAQPRDDLDFFFDWEQGYTSHNGKGVPVDEMESDADTVDFPDQQSQGGIEDPVSGNPSNPFQHYLVGKDAPASPDHSYLWTLTGGVMNKTTFKNCEVWFKGQADAGVGVIEAHKDGSWHFHFATVHRSKVMGGNAYKQLRKCILVDPKEKNVAKKVMKKQKWTEAYTFQRVAGGYLGKKPIEYIEWGIDPAYLLQGKVVYQTMASRKAITEGEISPYNFVKRVFAYGKDNKCKTLRECLKAMAATRSYVWHKCEGRMNMSQLGDDYDSYVNEIVVPVDRLWENLMKRT